MRVPLGRAINLVKSGLSIIPIGQNKVPLIPWKKYQTELIEKELLESSSQKDQFQGYGICTGHNGLECFDIDLKVFDSLIEQKSFWDEYYQMLKDHIDDFERKFVIYKTINSGYHIIYRCRTVEGNKKIATLKGHTAAVIETRGTGGYIFIYDNQISKLGYDEVQEISEDDRAILFGISKYFDYKEETEKIEVKESSEGLTPWDDFNNRNTVFDVFESDFTIVRQLKDKIVIKRQGATSPHSGYVFRESGLMYLFSTGTIYPVETALSPFSIYAHKYHHGNHTKAAGELYQKGYGERKKVKAKFEKPEIEENRLEFPIEVFPENIQTYLIESHKSLNHSIDYMGSSLLWVIALIIGNSCKIEVKTGWIESLNIWIALVGRPGIGKTPSINHIVYPLKKKNGFEIKSYQKEYKKFQEYNKLSAEEKKYAENVDEPIRKQFIVNDVTTEALVQLHEENPNAVGVFKDELNGWMKDMNKYRAGSDLEFWLSCFSNQQTSLTRKSAKSNFIDSPCIPVLGGIQPGIFGQIATDENKDNGFLDRLLLSFPDMQAPYYNRKNLDPSLILWYEGYISGFYDNVKKVVIRYNNQMEIDSWICTWDEEADREWERIYNSIVDMINSDNENEFVKSMLSKQISYIPRFALLLNCLYSYDCEDDSKIINLVTKDAVLGAEKLSKYFIAMAKKIKHDTLETRSLRQVLSELEGMPIDEKIRQIFKVFPDANKTEVAELLDTSRMKIYRTLK